MNLGDAASFALTPAARILKLGCVDQETGELRPDSNCAKRVEKLNSFGSKLYDMFWGEENDT